MVKLNVWPIIADDGEVAHGIVRKPVVGYMKRDEGERNGSIW
jgi:hypothetical protein